MIEIIPAVLPESFGELADALADVSGHAPLVHIDVCDGVFVPHVSWPYRPADITGFRALVNEEEGLPHWEDLDYEVHLMIDKPETQVEKWVRVGASRIIVQAEAVREFRALQSALSGLVDLGVCLKLETPLEAAEALVADGAFLHLMTIARIGFQGMKFDPAALHKIGEAHRRFPGVTISVDGGVNLDNVSPIIDAGARRLVVGSAIMGQENPALTYESFITLVQSHGDQ